MELSPGSVSCWPKNVTVECLRGVYYQILDDMMNARWLHVSLGCCLLLLQVILPLPQIDAASKRVKLCLQPTISGRCFGYVESYAYNPLKRHCEPFIYGGCGGNENRFTSKAECEFSCRDI